MDAEEGSIKMPLVVKLILIIVFVGVWCTMCNLKGELPKYMKVNTLKFLQKFFSQGSDA